MNNEVEQKITELKKRHTNIVLATVDDSGQALASQTPYVLDDAGNFLILVSGLAEHGKTLRAADAVNVMLMADEAGLANPGLDLFPPPEQAARAITARSTTTIRIKFRFIFHLLPL